MEANYLFVSVLYSEFARDRSTLYMISKYYFNNEPKSSTLEDLLVNSLKRSIVKGLGCLVLLIACIGVVYFLTGNIVKKRPISNISEQDIEDNFEQLRTALMNSYNSQTITHAGYAVAFLLGFFSLLASKRFGEFYDRRRITSYFVIGLILSLIVYSGLRLVFWSYISSDVLSVTKTDLQNVSGNTFIAKIQTFVLDRFRNGSRSPENSVTVWSYEFATSYTVVAPIVAMTFILGLSFSTIYYLKGPIIQGLHFVSIRLREKIRN